LFGMKDAVARIKAAKTAADETGIDFTLTARSEVYYTGSKTPFEIAVERCQAYADAGADCVFVPGLNDLQQLSELVKAVAVPVSFGMGATETPLTLEMLEDVGVTRVSTGGGITRAILAETQSIATRMMSTGDFSYLENALSEAEVTQVLTNGKAS